jgi:hypothetical protein
MHGFSFPSIHFMFLLTSTGETGEPISLVQSSNDAFPLKEVNFLGLIEKKIDTTKSVTLKNRQKVGMVYGFLAKLGESIKTHISVNSRDIGT